MESSFLRKRLATPGCNSSLSRMPKICFVRSSFLPSLVAIEPLLKWKDTPRMSICCAHKILSPIFTPKQKQTLSTMSWLPQNSSRSTSKESCQDDGPAAVVEDRRRQAKRALHHAKETRCGPLPPSSSRLNQRHDLPLSYARDFKIILRGFQYFCVLQQHGQLRHARRRQKGR